MEFRRRDDRAEKDAVIQSIRERFGFTRPFAAMLARRGLTDDASIAAYLHPESLPLPDSYRLKDMDRAVRRIQEAIERGERICIYGDYDTDGVCAAAILCDALKRLHADVSILLPDRHGEGYGLHMSAVDRIHADGAALIVTVDNGVSAHAEIAYAKQRGIDTVVTDHHRCHETLPDAEAVVCAARTDQDESLRCLCGASVAMLLVQALGEDIGRCLPVAALATMADLVPLQPVNRTIVRRGLPLVGLHPGVNALLDAAGVEGPVSETALSFILAPRINAAGRMGDAMRAVRLLLSDDPEERKAVATELEQENVRRRAEEQRIFNEASAQITETDPRILILRGTDWNSGVIGIVAARLLERYRCPVMLFTEVNGQLIGSGRSVPAVDLFSLLSRHAQRFTRFGGHRLAAGAAMPSESFEPLKEELRADLIERFPCGLPEEPLVYEDELALTEITPAFAKELSYLSPFGEENRAPLFRICGKLSGVRLIGRDGTHIGASLSDGTASVRIVAFGAGEHYADWSAIAEAQALVTVEQSSYRGKPEVSVRTEALRADMDDAVSSAIAACIRAVRFGQPLPERAVLARLPKITEAEIRGVYRALQQRLSNGVFAECLTAKEATALLPLLEIGVVRYENGKFFAQNVSEKKQIHTALLYPVLCLE